MADIVREPMQEQSAGAVAVALYLSVVRRLLKRSRGYECQEGNCTFMLAFESIMEATQFCIAVSCAPLLATPQMHWDA